MGDSIVSTARRCEWLGINEPRLSGLFLESRTLSLVSQMSRNPKARFKAEMPSIGSAEKTAVNLHVEQQAT